MDLTQETDNQQPSIQRNLDEGSETISKESRDNNPEAVPILTGKAEDDDIVRKNKAFLNYVKKGNQMFNNKFDYTRFTYINAKTKSTIICPTHGKFLQNMDKHTAKNSKGCPNCWKDNKPYPHWLGGKDIVSFKAFKEKANKIFQNLYEYDEDSYQGLTKTTLIVCKIHNKVEVLPTNFLKSKIGCPKCGEKQRSVNRTKSYLNFVKEANIIHGNKYKYPNVEGLYKNRKSTIQISCPIHGVFTKKAQKHLSKQGCFQCKIETLVQNNILVGGYSENLFLRKPELKDIPGTLYLMKVNHYYKVGITTKNVKNRVKGLIAKAKKSNEKLEIEVLKLNFDTLYNCFLLEQRILQENKEHRIFKKWSTELLKHIEIGKYF